jgi:[ribosomal protein S18]-alanine N-acetyltransferase
VELDIRPMSQGEALVVAVWQYEPPYSFYDWTADADDLAELLGKQTREGKYFSAVGADEELVGWFAFSYEGDCVGIGLGLRPDLTGRGLGLAYLQAGLAFATQRFTPSRFRLSVATFNERAIRVYERGGFSPLRTFDYATNGGIHPFLEMTRPA